MLTPLTTDEAIARGRAPRAFRADPGLGRLIRVGAGLRQGEVAALLGVNASTLSRWESGQRAPQGELLDRYRAILDRLQAETRG